MYSITFTCEVITPLYLSGYYKNSPELRPPSIKGLLRFWWRALNGNLTVEELRKKEAEIFGGSGENQGKSKVILGIEPIEPIERKVEKNKYNKYYIKPLSTFKLTIKSKQEEYLKQAVAAFWCLVYLGGIGARARRGEGNITVTNVQKSQNLNINLDFMPKEGKVSEVAEWLKENLNKAKNIVSGEDNKFISEYSNLSLARIIILKTVGLRL